MALFCAIAAPGHTRPAVSHYHSRPMPERPLIDQGPRPASASIALPISILILCCLFWGFSFPSMQISAAIFEKSLADYGIDLSNTRGQLASRSIFNAWRFALASAAFFLLPSPRQRRFSRSDLLGGLVVGLTFCIGILLQLIALRYILPSTSSFLTSLCVIFAPLAQTLLLRRPHGRRTILAIVVALIGMFILSQPNPHATTPQTIAQTPPFPHLGEILTIIGALLFTVQILSIDHFGQTADPTRLTLIMLAGICLGGASFHRAPVIHSLTHSQTFLICFVLLALLSSMLSQYLMNRYQPLIPPATAAVVYCLEPVFGTLFSVAFATERLSAITMIGGVIIILAVLIVARKNT